ncbi:MAG: hypothetical protein H0U44_05220 [Flavisolibacter sp.]|nr:hypothetical protein [Flavisolibacter sp.]
MRKRTVLLLIMIIFAFSGCICLNAGKPSVTLFNLTLPGVCNHQEVVVKENTDPFKILPVLILF